MTQKICDTGALLRDISWVVMASLLALTALDPDGEQARRADEREALAWHAAITINALNGRSMLVGGNVFLQCEPTLIGGIQAPSEPEHSRMLRVAYKYTAHADEKN
jgi:hypothetical protein